MRDQSPAAGSEIRRRPGGRSATVTSRVRAATFDLLAEVGYEGLQLPDVARRAGVNKTTVYRRWATKPHLVAHLLTELADEQVPNPDTGSLKTDLAEMLTRVAAVLKLPVARAVITAVITLADDDPEVARLRQDFWDRQFSDASIVITRAIDRGELPEGTEPRFFLEQVFGPVYFRQIITGGELSNKELHAIAAKYATHSIR